MATKKNVQEKADEVKEVTLFENEQKEEVPAPAKEETPKKKSAKKVTGKKPVEKAVKKVAKKKPAPAKDETPVEKQEAKKEEVSARDKMFPVNLTLEDGTVLTRWDVKSWGVLKKGFEKAQQTEGSIFVAVNYPKKYRKDYITSYAVNMPKEGFPNNLDLMEVMFLQQTIDRLVGLSIYTEALGLVYAEEVESRTKEGWFDLNGAETEIYFASKETK